MAGVHTFFKKELTFQDAKNLLKNNSQVRKAASTSSGGGYQPLGLVLPLSWYSPSNCCT